MATTVVMEEAGTADIKPKTGTTPMQIQEIILEMVATENRSERSVFRN